MSSNTSKDVAFRVARELAEGTASIQDAYTDAMEEFQELKDAGKSDAEIAKIVTECKPHFMNAIQAGATAAVARINVICIAAVDDAEYAAATNAAGRAFHELDQAMEAAEETYDSLTNKDSMEAGVLFLGFLASAASIALQVGTALGPVVVGALNQAAGNSEDTFSMIASIKDALDGSDIKVVTRSFSLAPGQSVTVNVPNQGNANVMAIPGRRVNYTVAVAVFSTQRPSGRPITLQGPAARNAALRGLLANEQIKVMNTGRVTVSITMELP